MAYTIATGVTPLPAKINLTGTVSSTGAAVTGTGTLFLTELFNTGGSLRANMKYKWLYSAVNGEVREIINIMGDTTMVIKSAFTANLSGEQMMVITDNSQYESISLNPLGAGTKLATAGGASLAMDANTTKNIDNPYDFPIVVNATAANVEVLS